LEATPAVAASSIAKNFVPMTDDAFQKTLAAGAFCALLDGLWSPQLHSSDNTNRTSLVTHHR
jgi:hypothetical protein